MQTNAMQCMGKVEDSKVKLGNQKHQKPLKKIFFLALCLTQRSLLRRRNFVFGLIFGRRLTSYYSELFIEGVRSYVCHVTRLNTVWKKSTFCKRL